MNTIICHKCGATLPDVPGRGRARCSRCVRADRTRRTREGREVTGAISPATVRKIRAMPVEGGFRHDQSKPAERRVATLFDRPGIDADEIEAGLSEYRAALVTAQSLARRWGCDVEAIYASDVEFTRRLRLREREIV